MKEMQRQDIKTMIDRLDTISTGDDIEDHIINSAIIMLEDLGNLVNKLQLENANLKQELALINKFVL